MNPRAAFLLIVAVVAVVALLVWLAVWWLGRRAGVRRAEFKRMAGDRDQLAEAIVQIEAKADLYRELDSVLATDVRQILRDLNRNRMDRYK